MASKQGAKPKLGAVIAIPLPGGKYAFAKVYKDEDLGVYDFVSDKIEPISVVSRHEIAFFQGCTYDPIVSGKWPIIGEEGFADDEAAWPPPRARGALPGMPVFPELLQITFKGSLRHAQPREVAGLDIATIYLDPDKFVEEIVDRVVRHDHTKYRMPK